MNIDEIFEAMKKNKKIVFSDSYGEKRLSVISLIEKDSGGTYRVRDKDDNDYSIDCIEGFNPEKVKDYQVTIKGCYDVDNEVIEKIISDIFSDVEMIYQFLVVKTVS